jgi:L-amino acid N-acyltransferase YncA
MSIIRPSRADDVAAIASIYAQHVLGGTGTFEIDPPTTEDMAHRRAEVLARGLPYLVAETDARVVGFAYCNWFKPRPAYRFSAEDSVYVDSQHAPNRYRARTASRIAGRCGAGGRSSADCGDRGLPQCRLDRPAPCCGLFSLRAC